MSSKEPVQFVIKADEKRDPTALDRAEQWVKVGSLAAIPVMLGLVGFCTDVSISSDEVGKDYVELATTILTTGSNAGEDLRRWAVDLLDDQSPLPLPEDAKARLKDGRTSLPAFFDGRFSNVRSASNALTKVVGDAMLRAAPGANASVYNSGLLRLDRVVEVENLTSDVLRELIAFNNELIEVEVPGALLLRLLDDSEQNAGTGAFLHTKGITRQNGWYLGTERIGSGSLYRIVTSDYLLAGGDGYEYLNDESSVKEIGRNGLMYDAVLNELLSRVSLDAN